MTPSTRTPVTICPTRFAEGYVALQYAGGPLIISEISPEPTSLKYRKSLKRGQRKGVRSMHRGRKK